MANGAVPSGGLFETLAASGFWTLPIAPEETLLRLAAAMGCGLVIGIDREWRGRPAGLRTHMLVSLASATFTIAAFAIYDSIRALEGQTAADPLRLLEAITAGVAFLAAGAIIRHSGEIQGLTTGAGLWLSGALGMACGAALFGLAAMVTVLAFFVLAVLRGVERWMTGDDK